MIFPNIKQRAEVIRYDFNHPGNLAEVLEDDTFFGEAVRILYEQARTIMSFDISRRYGFANSEDVLAALREIKSCLEEFKTDANNESIYNRFIISHDFLIKEYNELLDKIAYGWKYNWVDKTWSAPEEVIKTKATKTKDKALKEANRLIRKIKKG